MATQRPLVGRGERGADFVARRGDGQATRFYAYVGGAPAVLVFAAGDVDGLRRLVSTIRDAVGPGIDIHVVARDGGDGDAATFHDPQGTVHAAYGVAADGAPTMVVLDPNVRVLGAHQGDEGQVVQAVAADVAAATHDGSGVVVGRHAPVLFVADALSSALCTQLIDVFERSGAVATGVETSAGAHRVEQTDELRKRRRDHTVTDPDLLRTLSTHIGRRVMPEIRKAFVYEATRFEGFKIGCYEASDRGFFTAHRDNLSPATAHRRFGLTLNLNDDYDGGELRFPEYGPDRYRPDAGEALVFSGSHLHEVLPVTRGRRFVLLSFLFRDAPEAVGRQGAATR